MIQRNLMLILSFFFISAAPNGDKGGALLFREFSDEPWFAVGILSSYGGSNTAYYTTVNEFLPWISKNLT